MNVKNWSSIRREPDRQSSDRQFFTRTKYCDSFGIQPNPISCSFSYSFSILQLKFAYTSIITHRAFIQRNEVKTNTVPLSPADKSRLAFDKLRQTTWFGFLTGLCAIFALRRLRFSFSLRSVKSRTSSRFSRLKQTASFSFSYSFSFSFSILIL